MKRLFIMLSIILLTCSCSRYRELNSISIISNITIEKKDNKYNIIMQEIIPKSSDKKIDYDYKYRRSSSNSFKNAINNIKNHSPKKIYLMKVQNIIIGNKNKDIILKEVRKYYKKYKDINKECSIVIAKNDLYKVLKANSDYKYIDSVLKNKKVLLRNVSKKSKIKIPIIEISNKELLFNKYYYLHV